MNDATRARLEALRATLQFTLRDKNRLIALREDHLTEALDLADTLLAAYDAQAARLAAAERVCAAAVAWADTSLDCYEVSAVLEAAVGAWRAEEHADG